MIISRSPLRLSIAGGGCDLKSYYSHFGCLFISAAIDQYIYTCINETSHHDFMIRYSKIEHPKSIDDIKHPIIKECLKYTGINNTNLEITSMADHSAGTGLGSSSSFTTSLLKACYRYKNQSISQQKLAELACHIEIDLLKEPIGCQDQFIAAYGGLTTFVVNKEGVVTVSPLNISRDNIIDFENNLLMVPVGETRSASAILKEQDDKSKQMDKSMIDNLHKVQELAFRCKESLEKGNLTDFGLIMREHWENKKKRSSSMSNPQIDQLHDFGLQNGAVGGKLCFEPNTLVKTEFGHVKICNININDKVYDHQHNLQTVNETYCRYYSGNMLKIHIKGLQYPILVTPEHPLFTTKKHPNNKREFDSRKIINLPIFKEAKDFKKEDVLLVPINSKIEDIESINFNKTTKQSKYSNCNIYDGIPDKLLINYDLLNTLGWYIAEGSANNKQFSFAMNIKEIDYAHELKNSIFNMFGKTCTIKTYDNNLYLIGTSKVLCDFFNNLCGKYAENKKIPEFVLNLPIEKQKVLFFALWRGDGCVRTTFDKRTNKYYTRCSYKTVSFKLAKQVQELCHRLGFISCLNHEIPKNIRHQISYTVSLNGADAIAFKKSIESNKLHQVERGNRFQLSLQKEIIKIDGALYAKRSISKIEEIPYDGYVYNLNINNINTYIAEDIAVHNCGAGGSGFLLFYTENKNTLKQSLKQSGFKSFNVKFDYEGTKIL